MRPIPCRRCVGATAVSPMYPLDTPSVIARKNPTIAPPFVGDQRAVRRRVEPREAGRVGDPGMVPAARELQRLHGFAVGFLGGSNKNGWTHGTPPQSDAKRVVTGLAARHLGARAPAGGGVTLYRGDETTVAGPRS
jgi:hypothetical protein